MNRLMLVLQSRITHFGALGVVLLTCLLLTNIAAADSSPLKPVAKKAAVPPFGFRAVEIFKASNDAAGLEVVDINGDGRLDLVYPDNDEATIRLLIQRAPGEAVEEELDTAGSVVKSSLNDVASDPRFRVEKFHTDKHVNALAIADFNGDERPDLAYYTDPPELEVVFQTQPWGGEREKFTIRDGSETPYALQAADLNGDGKTDIALLGKGKTYLFHQKPEGGLHSPVEIYVPAQEVFDIEAADVDGNGRADLIYIVPGSENSVLVQLQGEKGFGPFRLNRLKDLRSWLLAPFRLLKDEEAAPTFLGVQRASKRLKISRWRSRTNAQGLTSPRVVAFGAEGDVRKIKRLIADVDGDGRLDLVVSHPEVAQLHVFFQERSGELTKRTVYPTLAGVNGLSTIDVDGDTTGEIVVTSDQEKVVGVSDWSGTRLEFPTTSPLPNTPILITTGRAGDVKSSERSTFVLTQGDGGVYELWALRMRLEDDAEEVLRHEMKLKSRPLAMEITDINGDRLDDVLIFVPYAAPTLLLKGADDTGKPVYKDVAESSAAALGPLAKVQPRSVSVIDGRSFQADSVAPGKLFLLSAKKYVRALQLTDKLRLKVLEQFSGRGAGADVQAAVTLQLDDDPEREVVLYDVGAGEIELMDRDEAGSYIRKDTIEIPKIDVDRMETHDMNGDGLEDLVLLGMNRAAILFRSDEDDGFEEALSYSVDDEKDLGNPEDLTVGDLNGDGLSDVVMSTVPRYNLLFLSLERDIELKTGVDGESASSPSTDELNLRLTFPVFEEKSYMRRSSVGGPRVMTVADFDGDGLQDLVLLIHDRILLYLQDS